MNGLFLLTFITYCYTFNKNSLMFARMFDQPNGAATNNIVVRDRYQLQICKIISIACLGTFCN